MLSIPFFPLDLPLAHIDALAMEWIAWRQALFGTTTESGALQRLERHMLNHVRALQSRLNESVRVALLALHDEWAPRALAGAHVLLRLAPNTLVDALRGLLPTARFWLLDALRHAPPESLKRVPLNHPVLIDAASMHAPMAEPALAELLEHPREDFRRAALLAAARAGPGGRAWLPSIERAAREGDAPERLVAFYALGRTGGAEVFDSGHDLPWQRASLEIHPLRVAAVFGSKRAVTLITATPLAALTPEHIHALGLAGRPESIEFLAGVLRHRVDLAEETIHSLYLVMGDSAVSLQQAHDSLTDSTLDPILRAAAAAEGVRLHLGQRLDREINLMSHMWLKSLLVPSSSVSLANELPDWLLGGGYARAGWPRLSLGPRQGDR